MEDNIMKYLNDNERNAVLELKEKILKKYPNTKFILFSSRARGDYEEYSDYDSYKRRL